MYTKLKEVLNRAVAQAESGKGKECHAREGVPFERQPICEIGRMVGIGFNLGQAMKKAQEADRFETGNPERAVKDLLGAINFLASAVMLIEENVGAVQEVNLRDQKETITREEAENMGLITDPMKIVRPQRETRLSKMLREQEEAALPANLGPEVADEDRHPKVVFRRYADIGPKCEVVNPPEAEPCPICHQMGGHHYQCLNLFEPEPCPTCHEKDGHHHSQCARNPNRDPQGRATLGGRRD